MHSLLHRLLCLACIVVASSSMTLAEPLNIVIIAPEEERSNVIGEPSDDDGYFPAVWYDLDEIKLHLEGLLAGNPAYQGSTVTVLDSARTLLTLHRAFYTFADGFDDFENLENNQYDVAILINDGDTLAVAATHCYEGTWHMANKLLKKGSEVYLLEPDPVSFVDAVAQGFMQESPNAITNRIANGCGIHTVAAGSALDSLVGEREHIDYIFSSSIYSTITGQGNHTNNTYSPAAIGAATRASIETATIDAIASEKQRTNYTGSFNGKSTVIHRPIDTNGMIRFAKTGTSTERSIEQSILGLVSHYRMDGVTPTVGDFYQASTTLFSEDPMLLAGEDQYQFSFYRFIFNDQTVLREPADTAPQPDLLPMVFTRHSSTGSATRPYSTGAFSGIYNEGVFHCALAATNNGYSIPSLSIAGRVYDQYGDIEALPYVYDGEHQTALHTDAVAGGFIASAIGIDFDNDELDRSKFYYEKSLYFMGWDIVMQQAYLSEDRQYTPDSDLVVSTDLLPSSSATSPLAIQLAASGGTAPYSWQETTGELPVGISLHQDGTLSGAPTYGGAQTYNLVFKVTDANGAIRKKGLELSTVGHNAQAAHYGWDSGYYFDTANTGDFISGTVIIALNGGGADITVNGIDFSAHSLSGGSKAAFTANAPSTGDSDYDRLLSTMSEGSSNEEFISLSGLTAGETYTLQVFYNNKNDDGYAAQMIANIDGVGDVVLRGSHDTADSTSFGSYGVAHFIASSSAVQLSLRARSDQHSIKGTAAFNALLLTQQPTNIIHTGTTRHAEISWTTPVEVVGLQDLIEGTPVKALNGGTSDITVDAFGVTFEAASIGLEADEPNSDTQSYGNSLFASLISEQTRTKNIASVTFDNLTEGQQYQIQIFNKSKSITEYSHTQFYRGSDTFFGLPNQNEVHIFEDGKVMHSVGTFTAQSTSQVIELRANESDLVQDISYSAMYLVESPHLVSVPDNGSNRAPTIAEINGNNTTSVDLDAAINTQLTTFTASDPDAGDILTYSIVSGNENGAFRIDSATGALWLIDNLTGSPQGAYTIDVVVSDNKIPAASATMQYTVRAIVSEDTDGDGYSDAVENIHGTNHFDATLQPFLLGYWDFNDPSDPSIAKGGITTPDGAITGGAVYTADSGGFSGQAGDYGIDFGLTVSNEKMEITDLDVINNAAKNDSISFSWWQNTHINDFGAALEFAGPGFSLIVYNPRTSSLSGIFVNDERIWHSPQRTNTWINYAISKDGTNIRYWIDGVEQNNGTTPTPISETLTRIVFGARGTNGSNSIRAVMDELAVYNGPLSQAQVTSLAQGQSPLNLIDSDTDGLIDSWEELYFGDLNTADGDSDTDGDGHSDRSEFIGGTSPTDKSSLLEIDQILVDGDSGKLSWKGQRNRVYRLGYSEDLTEWNLIDGEYTVNTDDEEITIELNADGTALPEKGFYRIEVTF